MRWSLGAESPDFSRGSKPGDFQLLTMLFACDSQFLIPFIRPKIDPGENSQLETAGSCGICYSRTKNKW